MTPQEYPSAVETSTEPANVPANEPAVDSSAGTNRQTLIKICGLQSVEVLKSVIKLPVDLIGLVFAPSRRRLSPEAAAPLVAALRAERSAHGSQKPLAAGVFVNPSEAEMEQVMALAPLDVIQLHGQESAETCRKVKERFGVLVYKAIGIAEGSREAQQAEPAASTSTSPGRAKSADSFEDYLNAVDGLLLDTYDPAQGGGTGKTFAWELIPHYRNKAREAGIPLLIAGGLHADNVAGLIGDYGPDGVDVSSGVETDGVKDLDKIARFVERVRNQ